MLSPDVHIVITISEEVIRLVCATGGFAVAVWGVIKIVGIIAKANEKNI